jgi:hypothetical protein
VSSMITSQEWIGPTRTIGLVAYATALMCCSITWIRTKGTRKTSRVAATLMLFESALLLDMAFNWRWKLHQALMDFALERHEYGQRRFPQVIAVSALAGLLLIGVVTAWRTFRGRGTTLLAVSGAWLSIVLWSVEVVSLHAVDRVLYTSLGGVMVVSLLWIAACALTSIGILRDPR